jgi:uncharacterized protein (TIGR02588 family)
MSQKNDSKIPAAEWAVAAAGLVIVCAVVGWMLYEAVAGDESPPQITVALDTVFPTEAGYLVRFAAANHGSETAAEVVIAGRSTGSTGEMEEAEVTLDYLPGQSERKGGFFFAKKPEPGGLELRALSYREP